MGVVTTSGKSLTSEILEYVQSIVVAGVLATIIILFIAQSFVVRGESMEATLHDGERLLIEKVSYRFKEPSRGDIIVLKTKSKEKYIKRIIGLPGDTVKVRDGKTFVNGKQVSDDFTLEGTAGEWPSQAPEYKVPSGKFFVMGDNRNHSDDSRLTVGYLPKADVVGKACFRYWPLGKIGTMARPDFFAKSDSE